MFDLGARFGGNCGPHVITRSHPGRPDAFSVAAHDYLGPNDFGHQPVDWETRDRHLTTVVYGVSTDDCIIRDLSGCADVERMAGFERWVQRPAVGDRIRPTRELFEAPYVVRFQTLETGLTTDELVRTVRELVRWNQGHAGLVGLRALLESLAKRLSRKLSWETRRMLSKSRAHGR